ncbi:DUF2784 domain-containing protein [bacterium]|nr:DUF2784 domain-containing protein [bacterium]
MESSTAFLLAADAILFAHVLVVVFTVFGLLFIFVGRALRWAWIRNPWFRIIHLLTILVVVLQSWFRIICPLTTIEMDFRSRAGDIQYKGSFIAHWLEFILYYQAPVWVFVFCYTVFGLLVVGSWFWVRPGTFKREEG